ncbi:pilus assembly FimT family protein [Geopsychrobacter electrodiphilus]|uniref:pilus assembly FimT family protein n=1 Tax=Geopsychrobacter electrodiphilus TaxID=225196 RepID=UPI00036A9B72|nr:type II secretion system protein [Geopsychrobacter electrodiphilus]
MNGQGQQGFTLLEMLVVVSVMGIIAALAAPNLHDYIARWQVRRAANQVYDDLQKAQQAALQAGNYGLNSAGRLAEKKLFWVFNVTNRSYQTFRWEDEDGDGTPDAGEATPLFMSTLPENVSFGMVSGVTRTACGDSVGSPAAAITFSAPGYPPCNDSPSLRFNKFGFSETGPGGIYLTKGEVSYALSMTRPGNITMCRWDGAHWRPM